MSFPFARGRASRKVYIGVLPQHQWPWWGMPVSILPSCHLENVEGQRIDLQLSDFNSVSDELDRGQGVIVDPPVLEPAIRARLESRWLALDGSRATYANRQPLDNMKTTGTQIRRSRSRPTCLSKPRETWE